MALWTYRIQPDPRQQPAREWQFVLLRNGAVAWVSQNYPNAKAAGEAAKKVIKESQQ